MEILRIGDWHIDFYNCWKHIDVEPTFDVLTFYLHPEQMCITIFNFTLSIDNHPKHD